MSEAAQNILVVDDKKSNRDLIGGIIGDNYKLKFAATGEECLAITESWCPDVILMDVNMPGMGGLETCKKVKEQSDVNSVSIIFLSSKSEIQERLAGYEAGGDDYLIKPFDHTELVTKVQLALDNKSKLVSFKKSSNDAMSMAMTAMSQASDIGNVLRFYQDSFAITTFEALAEKLADSIINFGVNAIIYFDLNGENYFYSSSGVVKPLEQSTIENLRDKARIYSLSQRTIFNYGIVSVLVIDMPVENEIKYGELKDNIAILVEGAQARMNALLIEIDREKQQQNNIKILKATKSSLTALEKQQSESQKEHQLIMTDLTGDIQDSFIRLGLTDEQENELMATMDVVTEKVNKVFGKNKVLHEKIKSVMKLLD